MNTLTKVSLAILFIGFFYTDLNAQRGGRGQGGPGNRNAQSAQQNQQQTGLGQNAQARNSQASGGRNGNGQMQAGRGQGISGQRGNGQGGRGQGINRQGQSGASISDQERTELTLMREEEKLARDVYVALNKKWGAPIFANISRAESKHMQAVAGLLSRYRITDPVVSNSPGSFTNPRFQQLYQSLVNEGSTSLVDAFKVGLKIEEMDIADLRVAIQSTDNNDIKQVFQHLEQGSQNHLRAFAAQLQKAGGTYTSTQLSQTEFNSIANSTPGKGGNQGLNGNQSRGQGQGRGQGFAQGQSTNQGPQGPAKAQGQNGQRKRQGKGRGGNGR